ncbi:glycosyltransferase family 4 protein [Altererythrobacter sp. ZODW24]|uniref:glycosyltransferase family 4 protein n=1 Tax=Altererythrobacter sp. ZODW24 TaxID=2185142 RepID=UPI0023DD3F86|nr:glycosyltransferase family 4 protein [Altererythrobacter sp. ZODW24]
MLRSLAGAMAADKHGVSVFAGQPSYAADARLTAAAEEIDGFSVKRVRTFREAKERPLIRGVNVAIYCVQLFFHVLLSRAEIVTAASFPPVFAGWTASLAAQLSGKQFIYHLQDIHPEVARVSGSRLGRGFLFRLLRWLDMQTMRRAARIVVLSGDMAATIMARPRPPARDKIAIINNFEIASFASEGGRSGLPLKQAGATRLIFAGNLGRFQNLGLFVEAAKIVESELPHFQLMFLGNGDSEAGLKAAAAGLGNVIFHDLLPYAEARHVIADADAGLVSLAEGVVSVSYPSKTFTYLGLGVPLALVVESKSELAQMVRSEGLGEVAEAATPEAVAQMYRAIAAQDHRDEICARVRSYHQRSLARDAIFARWNDLLLEVGR